MIRANGTTRSARGAPMGACGDLHCGRRGWIEEAQVTEVTG
jgi:hypothetical protein